jgi:hypothetical protein
MEGILLLRLDSAQLQRDHAGVNKPLSPARRDQGEVMAKVRRDVLHVRNFPKEKKEISDRVIVDFDEDPLTERFLVLDSEGGTIVLSYERITLGWDALIQLAELIQTGAKTLQSPRH